MVDRLVSQEPNGFARPNLPVTIQCIAFGAVMEPDASGGEQNNVINFLSNVSTRGGTRFPSSAADADDGYKWILGTQTQRQDRLRTAILKSLRSGVRIALIQ
jgi:hypothetical protein